MLTHHAYLYEGSQTDFENLKGSVQPFVATWYERFGIDDARALVAQASLKREGESTYLIGVSSLPTEAQQALLKLFEEPRQGLHFILVTPHGALLPTLRSRMMEYPAKMLHTADRVSAKDIPALIKEEDKERVREFLDAMESQLHPRMGEPKVRAALADIAMVRDYLRDRSPSLKMLLEHLALSLSSF
ncbi:MAG TPA: hypothetical protein VIY48_11300 [Candidatus Paceibacterota bacterium]